MKKRPRLTVLFGGIFSIAFVISAYVVFCIITEAHRERQTFDKLAELVEPSGKPSPFAEGTENPSPYQALKEQNPDFYGWISVEETVLNYPVMHTPNDPEYYLRRDFNGETSQSGVPFLSAFCYEGCGNYIIYGHHMYDGTMFASLLSYADREYWEQHPLIRFDTMTESAQYRVMAAFYAENYPQDAEGVFRYTLRRLIITPTTSKGVTIGSLSMFIPTKVYPEPAPSVVKASSAWSPTLWTERLT